MLITSDYNAKQILELFTLEGTGFNVYVREELHFSDENDFLEILPMIVNHKSFDLDILMKNRFVTYDFINKVYIKAIKKNTFYKKYGKAGYTPLLDNEIELLEEMRDRLATTK